MACTIEHSKSKDVFRAISEEPLPARRMRVESYGKEQFPVQCRHCEDAPCIYACMAGAISRDERTGVVLHDRDKCVACWMCVMVCPFGAVMPGYKQHTVLKCDRCPERDTPACVDACPTKALKYVDYGVQTGSFRKEAADRILFPERGRQI